jgi:hypothetical protein
VPLQWDADTDTPADAYYYPDSNADSNSHSYCDGYRPSQGYAAATRDASSSSKSTVIAGLWLGSDRLCFSEREDGPQGRGYSIYGFT